jgi:hypothetical protein
VNISEKMLSPALAVPHCAVIANVLFIVVSNPVIVSVEKLTPSKVVLAFFV